MTDLMPEMPPANLRKSRASMVVAGIIGVIVGALTFAAVTALSASGPAPAPAPEKQARQKPRPKPEAEPPATLEQRAAKGDQRAMQELEKVAREERTSEQVLALASARAAVKQAELEELQRKITLVPKFGRQDDVGKRIKELAADPQAGVATLRMLAGLENEVGPDLLYELATARGLGEIGELAEELVYTKDVSKHASQALSVALDLKAVEACESVLKVLERAKEHGDRRALVLLNRFFNKRGCGEKKRDDCFACLRDSDLLKEATAAVRTRRAP